MAALTSSFLGLSAPLKTVAKRTVAPKALPVKADLYPEFGTYPGAGESPVFAYNDDISSSSPTHTPHTPLPTHTWLPSPPRSSASRPRSRPSPSARSRPRRSPSRRTSTRCVHESAPRGERRARLGWEKRTAPGERARKTSTISLAPVSRRGPRVRARVLRRVALPPQTLQRAVCVRIRPVWGGKAVKRRVRQHNRKIALPPAAVLRFTAAARAENTHSPLRARARATWCLRDAKTRAFALSASPLAFSRAFPTPPPSRASNSQLPRPAFLLSRRSSARTRVAASPRCSATPTRRMPSAR